MGKQIRREISSAALADEVDLLRRVANGERLAFDVFYRAYYRRLLRFLEQVIRRPELIGEVLNDTMLVVWRKAGTFNQASRVSTWVFAIAYRRALKASSALRTAALRWTWRRSPSRWTARARAVADRARHSAALAGLSPDQRAVVELTYYHGYAYREVAQIVGCPVDTVKTRMFHARRKLRDLLADTRDKAP